MLRRTGWAVFGWMAVGVVLLFPPPPAAGCTCKLQHPQQHACKADFVLTLRVREEERTPEGLTFYKVRIRRTMKATDKSQLSLEKGKLYTIPGQCDIHLEKRVMYVVTGNTAGGKAWISACNFVKPWKDLAPKMKKGFRLLYQTGCDCPITSCHWWERCPPGNYFCGWETSTEKEDCQGRHGVCLRKPDGSCGWLGGRLYRSCMKNRTMSSYFSRNSNDIVPLGPMRSHYAHRKYPLFPRKQLKLSKSLVTPSNRYKYTNLYNH